VNGVRVWRCGYWIRFRVVTGGVTRPYLALTHVTCVLCVVWFQIDYEAFLCKVDRCYSNLYWVSVKPAALSSRIIVNRLNEIILKKKVKQSLDRPWGFQEVGSPRFQDNRHMRMVRLSALRTGRLYPPGNIPGTHFCYRLSRPQGRSAAGRIMSTKNSNDIIGNRTRELNQLRHRVPPPPQNKSIFSWDKVGNFSVIIANACI
jgi:hypothetical protein